MELFKLFGTIAVNNTGANSAIDETTDKAQSFSKNLSEKFTDIGEKTVRLGAKFMPLSTVIGGIGVVSGKMAFSFEDSMADINTLLDDSSHLHGYENAVKTTSRETGLAIENMASGMYQAISSLGDGGKETEKIFNTMARSAKAGKAEVSDSVALISAGMKGYNSVSDETAQRISDLAFLTAKLGVTTFPEMARSMQPLFPLSNSLNLSYEDLFGSMATLTGVTGNTAEVSTQLKAVFSNLMKPTTALEKLISQYGFSSAQAMLESEGFAGMLKIVQSETGGQADKMAELFSSTEAVTAMTALTGAQFDTFNYKLSEMGNATGATQIAYEKLNTSGDKLGRSWNNIKVTGLELGSTLVNILAPVIEELSEKASKFSEWFSSLDDRTQKFIITIGGFLVAAGPVLIFVGKIATGIGSVISIGSKLIGGITTLIPVISSISAPVALVIAGIAALVAIGVVLYKNWDTIKEKAGELKERVVSKVTEMKDNAVKRFTELKDGAEEKINRLKESTVSKIEEMKNNASEKVDEMKERITDGFQKLKEDGEEKFRDLKEKWSVKFTSAREKIVDEATRLKEKAGEKIGEFKNAAVEKIESFREGAVSKFQEFGSAAKDVLGSVSKSGIFGFQEIREKGLEAVRKLKTDAIAGFQEMGSVIAERFGSVADKIGSVFGSARDAVSKIVSDIKSFFDFEWKLPDIKLPHFNIKWDSSGMLGSLAEKIGLPGLPKFDVDWYQKAMDNPLIMDRPTAFGINRAGQVMAGGEAGSEVVSGTQTLMNMISAAVAENNSRMYELLNQLYDLLAAYLPELAKRQIVLETGALVGELAEPMSEKLAWENHLRGRRN